MKGINFLYFEETKFLAVSLSKKLSPLSFLILINRVLLAKFVSSITGCTFEKPSPFLRKPSPEPPSTKHLHENWSPFQMPQLTNYGSAIILGDCLIFFFRWALKFIIFRLISDIEGYQRWLERSLRVGRRLMRRWRPSPTQG